LATTEIESIWFYYNCKDINFLELLIAELSDQSNNHVEIGQLPVGRAHFAEAA